LVANTLANVPPGGLDLISRYQMTRSWGFPASSATSATVASRIFANVAKLILPVLAVLILATSPHLVPPRCIGGSRRLSKVVWVMRGWWVVDPATETD
jgi:hypothetical protein